ncbi:MAG: PAS domain-containing protein [Chloroflexi bacterium]|nr:PAS domain-containing protein [Chloroflexota bacterium]MBT4073988.1 PAS domain-containing protein [Chloroflexota bacterium]MBT5319809.1 PAS domain-containing protein [Chloroflexota bacterium]
MPSGRPVSPFDQFTTGEASFVVDHEFRVTRWSTGATELLGIDQREALGKRCYELLNGSDARNPGLCGRDCPIVTGTRRKPDVPDMDMLGRCSNGSYRWLNMTTLVHEPAGRSRRGSNGARQIMHLLRDVTDKRSVEEFARVSASAIRAARPPGISLNAATGEEVPIGDPLDHQAEDVAHTPQLSRRELQVLRLLSHGASTKEMADTLGVAPVTARNHVSRLLNRLGVGTRLQAVIYGARAGLI